MQRGLLFVLILLACGCARRPSHLPPADLIAEVDLVVFCDGFHSGIVLPRSAVPRDLDPMAPGWAALARGRSFHYGEQAWTSGQDMSSCHAVRLAFIPGRGMLQSDATPLDPPDIPGTERATFRTWKFPCTKAGRDALFKRLRQAWIADGAIPVLAEEGERSHLLLTHQDWSVWYNCHDFTADMLRAAGLDLPSHTIATAGLLIGDLDLAKTAMKQAGVTALSP